MNYDLIVVGGGPAGLTAALYARRANKRVLICEKENFGGQITYSPKVENYPGFSSVSGAGLADAMTEQVLSQGADAEMETVTALEKTDDGYTVRTEGASFTARAVILAVGVRHRMLGLPGEEALVGHGISFCAVCDGAFYRDKAVAVIGGGNSAVQEALLLAENCASVTMVQNLPALTADASLTERLRQRGNIRVICSTVVAALASADGELTALQLRAEDGTETRLAIDGAFVAIGLVPQNDAFAPLAALDERGYFDTTETCITRSPGLFVAGDCRAKGVRQVATAVGDGAVAAQAACAYLDAILTD